MLPKQFRKTALISFGNVIEWYDFSLFGYFTVILSTLFFPLDHSIYSLMAMYLTFGVGLLARPLGGFLFGLLGDRVCREKALRWSIYLMAVPTGLIGLLPTYEVAGVLAPILLIVMRLAQGLCAGGQYSGAVILSYEIASPRRRALQCSMNHVMSMAGYCLAILVSLSCFHLTHTWLSDNYWRIPFLVSPCLMILYFLFVRYWKVMLSDADPVLADQRQTALPFVQCFSQYRWNFLLATLLSACAGVLYFTLFVYMTSYMILNAHFTSTQAFLVNGVSTFISCVTVVSCALIVDRWGAQRVAQITIGMALLASLLFIPIGSMGMLSVVFIVVLMTTLNSAFIAAVLVIYPRLFPRNIRYTGMSFSYNLGAGLFGGAAPMVAAWVVHRQGNLGLTELLGITCFFTLLTMYFIYQKEGLLATD